MIFEWDDAKNALNQKKHGIDFKTAVDVFEDPFAVHKFDAAHSTIDEDRFDVIGFVHKVLFVVYTQKDDIEGEEVTRIISARRANRREINEYSQSKAGRHKISTQDDERGT